jgi:protein phosphatase 1L
VQKKEDVKIDTAKDYSNEFFDCAVVNTFGRREYNEDTFDINLDLHPNLKKVGYFGVYDGHGGDEASKFLKENLSSQIAKNLVNNEELSGAFTSLDKKIIDPSKGIQSGSCAIVVLAQPEANGEFKIICANVGDSRAFLLKGESAQALSKDHSPDEPKERERITEAGGFVTKGAVPRVCGVLAISRAFGDKELKSVDVGRDIITVDPDIRNTHAKAGDILLLASDGLFEPKNWDSEESIIKHVNPLLEKSNSLKEAAQELVNKCFKAGSHDNITVILVKLKNQAHYRPSQ